MEVTHSRHAQSWRLSIYGAVEGAQQSTHHELQCPPLHLLSSLPALVPHKLGLGETSQRRQICGRAKSHAERVRSRGAAPLAGVTIQEG
eukprot:1157568-Pelagomonas_calceolata.AAC.9